jgi:hypothetical protein
MAPGFEGLVPELAAGKASMLSRLRVKPSIEQRVLIAPKESVYGRRS